jgi:hypothetical protein
MSRKNSVVIKSPINGEEFQYNVDQDDDEDDDIPWGPDGQVVETTRGTTDNEYNFFSLPPLDLTCKIVHIFRFINRSIFL